ncbi:MAG: hypothetical protein SFZ23_05075 [Planctomycetota bacterium]|nr:hypothetical protein [Planctomycetota bacterium]
MRYDAYGQVLAADHLQAHPYLAVGHKGLFFDRLDRGVSDAQAQGAAPPPPGTVAPGLIATATMPETPLVVPFSRGVYHNRNRTYIPGGGSPQLIGLAGLTWNGPPGSTPTPGYSPNWQLSQTGLASGAAVHGRFMQADPNATGLALQLVGASMRSSSSGLAALDVLARHRDGANLYLALRGNPWSLSDPSGLFGGVSADAYLTIGCDRVALIGPPAMGVGAWCQLPACAAVP